MSEDKKEVEVVEPEVVMSAISDHDEIYDTSNKVGRSVIAVIDTITQRGGFKGEELSTIGQLRDQCIRMVQIVEAHQSKQR